MNQITTPDLHTQLQNDTAGTRRDELLARLQGMQNECLAAQQKLNDRETWKRIEASSAAVEAAIRIVQTAAGKKAAAPASPDQQRNQRPGAVTY